MSDDDLDDEHAVSLGTLEALFRFDGNPLHVWEAINIALGRVKQPLPGWVNAYLLDGARQILGIRDEAVADILDEGGADFEKVTDQAGRVGTALGFPNRRGVPSHFDAASLDTRNEHIVNDVMRVLRPEIGMDGDGARFSSPEKLDHAYDLVAQQWGLQRSTVVNACRNFLRRWRAASDTQPQPHASEMRLFVEWRLQAMNAAIEESQAARVVIDPDAQDEKLS